MDDELLDFYNKELTFLRRSAARFSQENPQAASALRISEDAIEDPHVEHLIQSVAFLNGRVRKKIEDDFPELNESLLDILYPHYLRPIPSMSIVKLRAQKGLSEDYTVPKDSLLETHPVDGEPVTFRTSYPVTLWPFKVTNAELVEGAYRAPPIPSYLDSSAVIKIQLTCDEEDIEFGTLKPDHIRFYIRGEEGLSSKLYTLIFNHVVGVSVADHSLDTSPVYLGPDAIQPVGFEDRDNLLEYSNRSFIGYRLLTEYFVFPKKFLFFDIKGLGKKLKGRGNKIELFLYLNKSFAGVSEFVDSSTFELGCTPIVNLFKQRAEPIIADGHCDEYHLVADSRQKLSKEIYQIEEVHVTGSNGEEIDISPFYGLNHDGKHSSLYWHARRRAVLNDKPNLSDNGTEVFVSIVNDNYLAQDAKKWIINTDTLCMNRDMPKRLPFGGGQPKLFLREGGLIEEIECLTPPTQTIRPSKKNGMRWRLISHISINHLPLFDNEQALSILKELLALYNFNDSLNTQALINGIDSIKTRQIASRVRSRGNTAICRGIEITLTLDETRYKDQNMFLFATVLERFFALYAPINSFTKLVLKTIQKEEPIRKWTPRASHQLLA